MVAANLQLALKGLKFETARRRLCRADAGGGFVASGMTVDPLGRETCQDIPAEQQIQSFPKVAIVVLNWNGWRHTIECLESLQRLTYPNYKVIVVDNGSTDDSVQRIRAWAAGELPVYSRFFRDAAVKPVRVVEQGEATPAIPGITDREDSSWAVHGSEEMVLIPTGVNLGFARGNNVGIRYTMAAGADFALVLNNDTVVTPSVLSLLVDFALKTPDAYLIGPKILDYRDGSDWQWPVAGPLTFASLLALFTPLSRLVRWSPLYRHLLYSGNAPRAVYAIPGSCMLFRRSCLERIGSLDEGTFVYWEEFIIAEKMKRSGLTTYIYPEVVIYHSLGESTRKLGPKKYIANVISENYFFDRYLRLHRWEKLVIKALRVLGYLVRMVGDRRYLRSFGEFLRALRAQPAGVDGRNA